MRVFRTVLLSGGVVSLLLSSLAHGGERLVIPYSCKVHGGHVDLIPSTRQAYRVYGARERQVLTTCSPAVPGRCRSWTLHRFDLDCGGTRVPWPRVVAAVSDRKTPGLAWLADGRLRREEAHGGLEPLLVLVAGLDGGTALGRHMSQHTSRHMSHHTNHHTSHHMGADHTSHHMVRRMCRHPPIGDVRMAIPAICGRLSARLRSPDGNTGAVYRCDRPRPKAQPVLPNAKNTLRRQMTAARSRSS